jgi:hypothetical protein
MHVLCSSHVQVCTVLQTNVSEVTFGFKTEQFKIVQQNLANYAFIDARVLTKDPNDSSSLRGKNGRDDDEVVVSVLAQQGSGSLVATALEDRPLDWLKSVLRPCVDLQPCPSLKVCRVTVLSHMQDLCNTGVAAIGCNWGVHRAPTVGRIAACWAPMLFGARVKAGRQYAAAL